jgi:hypothetical protein
MSKNSTFTLKRIILYTEPNCIIIGNEGAAAVCCVFLVFIDILSCAFMAYYQHNLGDIKWNSFVLMFMNYKCIYLFLLLKGS